MPQKITSGGLAFGASEGTAGRRRSLGTCPGSIASLSPPPRPPPPTSLSALARRPGFPGSVHMSARTAAGARNASRRGRNGSGLINLGRARHPSPGQAGPVAMCCTHARLSLRPAPLALRASPSPTADPPASPGPGGRRGSGDTASFPSRVPSSFLLFFTLSHQHLGWGAPPRSPPVPPSPLLLLLPTPTPASPSPQLISEFRRAWSFIWVITAQASGAGARLIPSLAAHYHLGLLP